MKTEAMTYNNTTKQWEFIFSSLATYDTANDRVILPFTTKDEYLAWRTEWRGIYRDLSESIRDQRNTDRRFTSVMKKRANRAAAGAKQENQDEYLVKLDDRLAKANARLKEITGGNSYRASELASWMLELRKQSKIESERQYQAQKVLVTA